MTTISWRMPTESELVDEFREPDVQSLFLPGYESSEVAEEAFSIFKVNLGRTRVSPGELAADNSWRFLPSDMGSFKAQLASYGSPRNPEAVRDAMLAGVEFPYPVLIHRRRGDYLLAGGATRTGVAYLLGEEVEALFMDEAAALDWRADRMLADLREYAGKSQDAPSEFQGEFIRNSIERIMKLRGISDPELLGTLGNTAWDSAPEMLDAAGSVLFRHNPPSAGFNPAASPADTDNCHEECQHP